MILDLRALAHRARAMLGAWVAPAGRDTEALRALTLWSGPYTAVSFADALAVTYDTAERLVEQMKGEGLVVALPGDHPAVESLWLPPWVAESIRAAMR